MNTQRDLFTDLADILAPTFQSFHNTTGLSGDELKKREIRAGSQNKLVLDTFRWFASKNPDWSFSAWDIHRQFRPIPITSIRRAISDLTKMGYLEKTSLKKKGEYGESCFTWRLRRKS